MIFISDREHRLPDSAVKDFGKGGPRDMNTLLELLEQDCTQSPAQLAAQAGMTEAEAKDELRRLEEEGVILGYQAVIDWDRVKRENVTALHLSV